MEVRNNPAQNPLIFERVLVHDIAQFGVDPLIYNEAVALPESAEIGLSDLLTGVAGYPLGTRPIRKGAEPIEV